MNPSQPKRKKWWTTVVITILVYVSVYVALSMSGEYGRRALASQSVKYRTGLNVLTRFVWQPKLVEDYPDDHSVMGIVFWPVIALDRRFWHCDQDALEFFDDTANRE